MCVFLSSLTNTLICLVFFLLFVFAQGICCAKFRQPFFLFKILNVKETNTMKNDVPPKKWSNIVMFFDVFITLCFKQQSPQIACFFPRTKKKFARRKKHFTNKIHLRYAIKNRMHSHYLLDQTMVCVIEWALHGLYGRAAKSLCKTCNVCTVQPFCQILQEGANLEICKDVQPNLSAKDFACQHAVKICQHLLF